MGNKQSFDSKESQSSAKGKRKKNFILQRKNEFPSRLRSAIEKAQKECKNSKDFISAIRDKLADWLFENMLPKDLNTDGLNDERDTEQEIELALNFFPEVLSMRRCGLCPIFWLSKSIKSVSFVPLFAKLGAESGLFREFERGGLVFGSNSMNIFSNLATTCTDDAARKRNDVTFQALVDKKILTVIQRLREYNLMKKTDIREFDMINILCYQTIFPEQRFKYLVDWDPDILLSDFDQGRALSLPLVARFFKKNDMSGFRMLFLLSLQHFPNELGFLFHKINNASRSTSTIIEERIGNKRRFSAINFLKESTSLYDAACETFGNDLVRGIIIHGLHRQITNDKFFTREALVYAASCSEFIRTESLYFLLREDPAVCKR